MEHLVTAHKSNYLITKYPDDCPHCHKNITPSFISSNSFSNEIELLFRCPNIPCQRYFIGTYFRSDTPVMTKIDTYSATFKGISTSTLKEKKFAAVINDISPNFVIIYNEAFFAEQNNLSEICGVGYRKALEFLIKDYSILNSPDREEVIKKIPLASCIGEYVSDEKIKNVSKRAAWLGNDETHYVRTWIDKDLSDLKKLIDLTVHWIEMEELTKSFEIEMPQSPRN